jgi:hypothetical protein
MRVAVVVWWRVSLCICMIRQAVYRWLCLVCCCGVILRVMGKVSWYTERVFILFEYTALAIMSTGKSKGLGIRCRS